MKKSDPLQQYHALRSTLSREREAIQNRLQEINAALGGGETTFAPVTKKRGRPPGQAKSTATTLSLPKPVKKKNKMSAAGLANIKAAQKARWAKIKASVPAVVKTEAAKPTPKKRKMSAEGRKAIAEAVKKRWAKVKAEKAQATK